AAGHGHRPETASGPLVAQEEQRVSVWRHGRPVRILYNWLTTGAISGNTVDALDGFPADLAEIREDEGASVRGPHWCVQDLPGPLALRQRAGLATVSAGQVDL